MYIFGRRCWSYVGYTHQVNQTISIGEGCQSVSGAGRGGGPGYGWGSAGWGQSQVWGQGQRWGQELLHGFVMGMGQDRAEQARAG